LFEQVFAAASSQALFCFVEMLPQVVQVEHEYTVYRRGLGGPRALRGRPVGLHAGGSREGAGTALEQGCGLLRRPGHGR
jgi:hypothetical protein